MNEDIFSNMDDVFMEAREDLEEDILGQKIYFEGVIDEAVYSEHDFSKRKFNILNELKVLFYQIASLPRDERDAPFDTWEPEDFVVLEGMLAGKFREVRIFMKVCEEMKKALELAESSEDKGRVFDVSLKLLHRRAEQEAYDKNTILRMEKGLQNFYNEIF